MPMTHPVLDLFQRLVVAGTLNHAYIFVGNEFSQKADVAWEVASLILQTESGAVKHHPDVRWLTRTFDEKNEQLHRDISIDDIRTVLRFAQESSFKGGAKVIIIAEADRLNEKAYTALLKTLEEPAEKTYFFLLYQTPAAIPQTIRSRSQVFNFPTVDRGQYQQTRAEVISFLMADRSTRFTMIEPWFEAAKEAGGVDELVRRLELWHGALLPSAQLTDWLETGRTWSDLVQIQDQIRHTIKALRQNAHPKLTLEALLVQI